MTLGKDQIKGGNTNGRKGGPMPVVTKYICDGCGAEKGETNHWFKITKSADFIGIWTWPEQPDSAPMFCGEKCMLARISKWMQERKEAQ